MSTILLPIVLHKNPNIVMTNVTSYIFSPFPYLDRCIPITKTHSDLSFTYTMYDLVSDFVIVFFKFLSHLLLSELRFFSYFFIYSPSVFFLSFTFHFTLSLLFISSYYCNLHSPKLLVSLSFPTVWLNSFVLGWNTADLLCMKDEFRCVYLMLLPFSAVWLSLKSFRPHRRLQSVLSEKFFPK